VLRNELELNLRMLRTLSKFMIDIVGGEILQINVNPILMSCTRYPMTNKETKNRRTYVSNRGHYGPRG